MRRLITLLAVFPLFIISPVIGIVGLGLFALAHIPYVVAWALRRSADGVEMAGDGIRAVSTLTYKAQDRVVAKRDDLISAYRHYTAEVLAQKEQELEAVQAEVAAAKAAACG